MDDRLGDFLLRHPIASGGMGTVFLALQESLQREVAVKVLHPHYGSDPEFVERFIREARSAAQLRHPNIIQILAVGHEQERHYFAMEFVDGRNLKQLLQERLRLSVTEALDIIIKVSDALVCAADAGLIHRDLKPENIMITPQNRVKVTDFGLAKCVLAATTQLTAAGRILGTVNYMSPEQGLGQPLDIRSDIYSLGAVFFELLAGRAPFKGDHPTSVVFMHVYEPAPPVSHFNKAVPPAVERLIQRMMAKQPESRPQTVRELLAELETARDACATTRRANAREETTGYAHPNRGDTPYCLIIDADSAGSKLVHRRLVERGCTVRVVPDGLQGLSVWKQCSPDLVVLDLELPSLGGMALLEERSRSNLSGDVLVLTGASNWSVIRRAATHKVSGYLLKPVEIDRLDQTLDRLLPGGALEKNPQQVP